MFRKLTILSISLLMLTATIFAQTPVKIKLEVLGVSPRMVAKSTTDIYTDASTGLNNVGLGSLVYLKASINGKKFGTAVAYSITRRPSGSTAAIGTAKDVINDSTQVVTFTPDKLGAYEITIADGVYSTTVTLNSAKYLGYTNSVVNGVDTKVTCKTCHSTQVTEFEKTGHAVALKYPIDNYASFRSTCISCHTTGYNTKTTAVNDGFDDFTFTFPTVIATGNYDKLLKDFPDAMKRANVQCEACHGPGGAHAAHSGCCTGAGDHRQSQREGELPGPRREMGLCPHAPLGGSAPLCDGWRRRGGLRHFAAGVHATRPGVRAHAGREEYRRPSYPHPQHQPDSIDGDAVCSREGAQPVPGGRHCLFEDRHGGDGGRPDAAEHLGHLRHPQAAEGMAQPA